MGTSYLISDLHFGHNNGPKFANYLFGTTLDEYHKTLIERWNSVVRKGDSVYALGDMAWNAQGLLLCRELNGIKTLIRGNHDKLSAWAYLNIFQNIHGMLKKDGFWLTHAPLHPQELREIKNIHGHVHFATIQDPRYINICACVRDGFPVSFEQIKKECGNV